MKENVKFNNRVVLFCLTAAAGISLFALAGWFAGWAHISSFGAGYIPMAPNTALVFLTSAAAMYVLRKFGSQENKSEPAVMVIVSLNTILLFLTIVDTLSGRHLNIDGMIIRAAGFVGGVPIGSMSLLTAAFFLLLNISILLLLGRHLKAAGLAGTSIIAGSFVIIMGYVYRTPFLYGSNVIPMAFSTAFGFLYSGAAAIFLAGDDTWPLKGFIGDSARARILRTLLPPLLFIQILMGLIDASFFIPYGNTTVLYAAVTMIAVTVLVYAVIMILSKKIGDELEKNLEEKKSVQLALSESEKKYKALIDNLPDAMFLCDAQTGRIVEVNPAGCRLVKKSRHEIIGMLQSQLHPSRLKDYPSEVFKEHIKQVEKCGETLPLEIPVLCSDGSEVQVEIVSRAVELDGKKILQGVFRDISQRKKAERELIEITNRVKALNDNLADGMVYQINSGKDGTLREFSYISQAVEKLHGVKVSEALENPMLIYGQIHPDDRAALAEKEKKAFEAKGKLEFEARVVLPSGATRWRQFVSVPHYDHNGCVLWDGIELDITERKKNEKEMAQKEWFLARSQEAANIGSYVMDVKAGKWESSKVLDGIFGIPEDYVRDVAGWGAIVHPDYRDGMLSYFKDEVVGKKKRFNKIYMIKRKSDGVERWVHGIGDLEFDEAGSVTAMVGTIQDITERKIVEDELSLHREHLEELVKKRTHELVLLNDDLKSFAYSISHDLKAPLRAIIGFANMLREDYKGKLGAVAEGYISRIVKSTARLDDLIEAILRLSRVSSAELENKKINLSKILENVFVEISQSNPEQKAKLGGLTEAFVVADPELIRTALYNLVSNAFKYSKKGEVIEIEFGACEKDGKKIYFIKDNGVGFDMTYVGKLFGIFQRLHSQDDFPGIGIGLATVRKIINRHGGEIWAEASEGQGAVFYFTLGNGAQA